MTEKENFLSIIDDKNLDRFSKISCKRKRNKYKVFYKKNSTFLKKGEYDDFFLAYFLVTIVICGLTLLFTLFPVIWLWFIVPIFCFCLMMYYTFKSAVATREDWILSIYMFIISIGFTWFMLFVGIETDYYANKDTRNYLKEKVPVEWIMFKNNK